MVERVDMREEITSAEAGLTFTWFADERRRLGAGSMGTGTERRRQSAVVLEAVEVVEVVEV